MQTFRSFTQDIERMADWLVSLGIKAVAMESTRVYWIPVYEILEERGLDVVLVNARDCKAAEKIIEKMGFCKWLKCAGEWQYVA